MADRATLGATLDRFAAAFTALAALLGAAPDAELVDRVRAGDQLAQWPVTDDDESLPGCALLEESASAHEDATVVRRDYNRSFLADHLLVWAPKCLTQAAEGATTHFYLGVAALGLGALAAAEDAFLRVP
jgi:TorA maturation chaperone TorD